MIAPDLPLEPAPRNAFSSSTTRPARRRARCQAMLVPMTPPPTIRRSQLTAMRHDRRENTPAAERRRDCGEESRRLPAAGVGMLALLREQRRAQVALAEVGQHDHDQLPGVLGPLR